MKTIIILILQLFSANTWSPPIGLDRIKQAESLYFRSKLSSGIYGCYLAVQSYRLICKGKSGLLKVQTSDKFYVSLLRLLRMIALDDGFDKFDYDKPFEHIIHPPFREDYADALVRYLSAQKSVSYQDLFAAHHPGATAEVLNSTNGTAFLISLDLEALVSCTREQILGINSTSSFKSPSAELVALADTRAETDHKALPPPDEALNAVVSIRSKNILQIDVLRSDWRDRFIAIFDPHTGSHTDTTTRRLVWEHFENDVLNHTVSDISLARRWAKAFYPASGIRSHEISPDLFPDLWERYNPVLGLSSVRLQGG